MDVHSLAGGGSVAVGNHNFEFVVDVVVGTQAIGLGIVQHILVGVGNACTYIFGRVRTVFVAVGTAGGNDKLAIFALVHEIAVGVLHQGNRRVAQQQAHFLGVVGVNILDGKRTAVSILAHVTGIFGSTGISDVVVVIGSAVAVRFARFHNREVHRRGGTTRGVVVLTFQGNADGLGVIGIVPVGNRYIELEVNLIVLVQKISLGSE